MLGSTRIDRWCYSTSKAVGEHFCFAYHTMGLPVTITRYFNVYGPRLDKLDVGRVITIFMGQLLRDEPLTVIGDGKQTRCFTYIDDAVRATIAAGVGAGHRRRGVQHRHRRRDDRSSSSPKQMIAVTGCAQPHRVRRRRRRCTATATRTSAAACPT